MTWKPNVCARINGWDGGDYPPSLLHIVVPGTTTALLGKGIEQISYINAYPPPSTFLLIQALIWGYGM